MSKSGFAFHCHPDVLCEYVYDYDARVRFIKEYKPKSEQKLRLKLFKLIPDELMPGRDSPDCKAYGKAWKAYDKAWEAYDKNYGEEIERLHAKLCPDCPWDGKTIFSVR